MKIEVKSDGVRGDAVVLSGFAFDSPALMSRHTAEFEAEQLIEKVVADAVAKQRASIAAVVERHAAACRQREELVQRLAALDGDRLSASVSHFGATLTAKLRAIDKETKAVGDLVVSTEREIEDAAERINQERSRASRAAADDVKKVIAAKRAVLERDRDDAERRLFVAVEELVARHQRAVGSLRSLAAADPAALVAVHVEGTIPAAPIDAWGAMFASTEPARDERDAVRSYAPVNQPGRVWEPEDYPSFDDER